ncbi:MAG: GNAT family N-acetyltransferase [Mucilaginibacter sp.]|uniref:GNAT family N-acetyltransferase n=1 Tax=Mucilaginibacter sp. TaxID=1882438 RepID=UPI0032670CDE
MLRPFTQPDFAQLNTWVSSEELLIQFSATAFPYPLNYADIEAYMLANPDRQFYMVSDEQLGDYGFGEIIPQKNNVPRLSRLLIGDPSLRGKGFGKKMILLLLDECRNTHSSTGAELYVLTDNQHAIKYYKSVGFNFIGDDIEINLKGNIKTMKKMRLNF